MPLIWTAAFAAGITCLRRPWSRGIVFLLFYASLFSAMFAVTEALFFWRESKPVYSDGYWTADEILGAAPAKGASGHASRTDGRKRLYDVTYSIDSSGQRVSPPLNAASPSACILFFGDSFTFGEGLNDNETLPYQVGLQSGGRYRTFNFGFHGYGPHQMLAAVENGVARKIVDCRPDYAIYQAIPDHAARVAGKVPYGKHAPRYHLESNGDVRYTGHFDDDVSALQVRVRTNFGKSAVYRWFENFWRPAISEEDVRLMLGVVRKARQQLTVTYPAIHFHVILWINREDERTIYQELRRGLGEMNVPVHLVEEILPDYRFGASRYVLSGADRHPTVLTNRLLADYVVNRIVQSAPVVPASRASQAYP